ncbi:hypothetical protein M2344_000310 [Sphingobium sp. B8D3C]|nr:hypothetical protein [Sphingobium sp. B8D3B]MCW2417348.1 hypothetical protein [Sphingobium sp. B8D3C]
MTKDKILHGRHARRLFKTRLKDATNRDHALRVAEQGKHARALLPVPIKAAPQQFRGEDNEALPDEIVRWRDPESPPTRSRRAPANPAGRESNLAASDGKVFAQLPPSEMTLQAARLT